MSVVTRYLEVWLHRVPLHAGGDHDGYAVNLSSGCLTRDVPELLAERCIAVNRVTIHRERASSSPALGRPDTGVQVVGDQ
jgi:hypothetical protein